MRRITLSDLPDSFAVGYDHGVTGSSLAVLDEITLLVQWPTLIDGRVLWDNAAHLPDEVLARVEQYMHASDKYGYAETAHCPRTDGDSYPICGSAKASPHAYDEFPVCETEEDFQALDKESTCWECRSLIA